MATYPLWITPQCVMIWTGNVGGLSFAFAVYHSHSLRMASKSSLALNPRDDLW